MVGSSCRSLVALGHRWVLPRGCSDTTLAEHDRETDLRHGEGILSGTCSGLHGRYPVGTPRDTSKRYVTFPPPLHRKSTRNIRVIETRERERERDFIAKNVVPSQKQRRGGAVRPKAQRRVSSWRIVPRIENAGFRFVDLPPGDNIVSSQRKSLQPRYTRRIS